MQARIPLWQRLVWMATIWTASIVAVGSVSGVIRLWLR
ncbi:DUF2474 domain-containing protein [Bradyrhizobium sp. Arg68]|nr:DUF2474 family protein [Bradyrhizobium ivorense]MCC8936175.1 DUF2474 domain-containing protein [Bradyrhizobium ivorense]